MKDEETIFGDIEISEENDILSPNFLSSQKRILIFAVCKAWSRVLVLGHARRISDSVLENLNFYQVPR